MHQGHRSNDSQIIISSESSTVGPIVQAGNGFIHIGPVDNESNSAHCEDFARMTQEENNMHTIQIEHQLTVIEVDGNFGRPSHNSDVLGIGGTLHSLTLLCSTCWVKGGDRN